MTYSVYVCNFTDKEKTTIETILSDKVFISLSEAFSYAKQYVGKPNFEHFEICRTDNNECIYLRDCRGIIEDYTK